MSELVQYGLEGDVARITMDDGKANALSFAMLEALEDGLDRAESEARVVLLTGREGRFSAGFDLSVMQSGPETTRDLVARGGHLCMRLYTLPLPVITVCTGHALAAGALVLLSSDWRVGVPGEFKIGLNEVAIGMPLPQFALALARDRLARTHLTRATALAHIYDPDGAVVSGYLDEVSPEAQEVAMSLAGQWSDGLSASGFAGTRRTARQPTADVVLAGLDDDLAHFSVDS